MNESWQVFHLLANYIGIDTHRCSLYNYSSVKEGEKKHTSKYSPFRFDFFFCFPFSSFLSINKCFNSIIVIVLRAELERKNLSNIFNKYVNIASNWNCGLEELNSERSIGRGRGLSLLSNRLLVSLLVHNVHCVHIHLSLSSICMLTQLEENLFDL